MKQRKRWEGIALIAGPVLCVLPWMFAGISSHSAGAGIGLGAYAGIAAVAAEVPSIVAWKRELPNRLQVYVLNLFLFWTVVGWVVALVMAVKPIEAEGKHA